MAKPNFVSFKKHSSKPAAKKLKTSKAKQIATGKTATKVAALEASRKLYKW
jgi:hypothetical protein